jgi:hypothetical protein
MSDGWELNYFGNFNQAAEDDYDGDGASNLQEFLNGTDPNKIEFSIDATNNYVGDVSTILPVNVTKGVPSSAAFMVDSTNFSAASWSSYTSSNITVNLGAIEGWHDVWIGLRGRLNTSQQTWQRKRLKLDLTPPSLVIIAPQNGTVSQPMIELLGYSPESLSAISCNLSNAAGLFTNEMILVLDQNYDTNMHEFTTNTFQGFDMELTNGANTIFLQAVDLAGNIRTTNFDITLVIDTNSPLFALYWPIDGSVVSGDSFTLRGFLDDFTAALTASIIDSSNNTNTGNAIVERDGNFWVENLPLGTGTNLVALTAMDAWGNVSTTNITVVKSDVSITIDPVPTEQLNEHFVTVTGSISTSGYSIWVNGVKSTNNGDGTWTAQRVPLPAGGTAVVQARAIPNSDNGGNGAGGGGGSSSYENPGNPQSGQASDAETQTDKPEGVFIDQHIEDDHVTVDRTYDAPSYDYWYDDSDDSVFNQHWDSQSGGDGLSMRTSISDSSDGFSTCEGKTVFDWPPSLSENGYAVTTVTGTGDCEEDYTPGEGWTPPPSICPQHCSTKYTYDQMWEDDVSVETWHEELNQTAQTKMKLYTGAKAVPKRNNLWMVTGSAAKILHDWEMNPCSQYADKESVASTRITIGELGKLDSDGKLYKWLPDGVTKDATPNVKGLDYYIFSASATKYLSHFEVFVRQPWPDYPNDDFFPDSPPLGYPVVAGFDAGHAWWKSASDAPLQAIQSFTQDPANEWVNVEAGYGPDGSSSFDWGRFLVEGVVKTNIGKVFAGDNGNANIHRTYGISFKSPGLIEGLNHTKTLSDNPGIWDSAVHNCVMEVRNTGGNSGLSLPDSENTPEGFGFELPPSSP